MPRITRRHGRAAAALAARLAMPVASAWIAIIVVQLILALPVSLTLQTFAASVQTAAAANWRYATLGYTLARDDLSIALLPTVAITLLPLAWLICLFLANRRSHTRTVVVHQNIKTVPPHPAAAATWFATSIAPAAVWFWFTL